MRPGAGYSGSITEHFDDIDYDMEDHPDRVLQ